MVSSPPDRPDDAAPEPQDIVLDTLAAQREAIARLIDLAQTTLQVFDRDLAEGGWGSAATTARLTAFLRRSRGARASIIVHDPRFIEEACPRLTGLLRNYSHAMALWRTGAEARGATDGLVIADGTHFLHRFHVDQPRAALVIGHPQRARPLVARFDEIWATGEPALGGSVLGL
jgi:hypothetical protein